MTILVCPHCAQQNLSTMERIYGGASTDRIAREEDGTIDVSHAGDTEIYWDSSITVGIICVDCYWEYEGDDWAEHLVPQPIEEVDEEFED